ncbi:MAG: hypothetical protein KDD32_02320 [Bacteroidetes bacterium]|nr:hypothetical protein [Bacteroidota bacterium]
MKKFIQRVKLSLILLAILIGSFTIFYEAKTLTLYLGVIQVALLIHIVIMNNGWYNLHHPNDI